MSDKGLIGSWGTNFPVTDTVKYVKQTAGLELYVPETIKFKHKEDGINNLLLLNYKKGEKMRFYITAAAMKEEKDPFTNSNQFFKYMKE